MKARHSQSELFTHNGTPVVNKVNTATVKKLTVRNMVLAHGFQIGASGRKVYVSTAKNA